MSYRRRASPLHAARAGAGIAWCMALLIAALMLNSPLALGALIAALVLAGVGARVTREVVRAALLALPLALAIALINALVSHQGLTVVLRLGNLPLLGHTDVTLEAIAYGGVLGLRAIALILCASIYTTAVDPDQVLRLFRRISFRSALTATLATRMLPLLARDARRLAEAQRCRPGPPASRFQLMRVITAGLLDRALDTAAALEVRGYGAAKRGATVSQPYSRHDLAFAISALAVLTLAILAKSAALAPFQAYPSLHAPVMPETFIVSAALIAAATLPFADRRGIV